MYTHLYGVVWGKAEYDAAQQLGKGQHGALSLEVLEGGLLHLPRLVSLLRGDSTLTTFRPVT